MEFFLASSDIVNIWESFLKKSTEKTPYDKMIWKNTWINHFSNGYKFEYLHNEDFFVPLKINDSIASIIGDKDIVVSDSPGVRLNCPSLLFTTFEKSKTAVTTTPKID